MTAVTAPVDGSRAAPFPVSRRWIADGWRGLLGWCVGVAAAILVYLPLFPAMNSPEFAGMLDALPPELVRTLGYEDLITGAGYAQATFFGLIGFVLISIAGIGWGAAFIGGAEESGRLELTLAHGVGRIQYALESAAALLLKLLILGSVGWLLVWAVNGPAELELDAAELLFVTMAWVGIGLLSAAAALAVGALTGRRVWGVGAGAGVAVIGYVLQAVANNSADLDWLRVLSPFEWAYGNAPLTNGVDWAGLGLLWGGSAIFIAMGTVALARKDVLG
jgi:ABC-2 type transport system permease protein